MEQLQKILVIFVVLGVIAVVALGIGLWSLSKYLNIEKKKCDNDPKFKCESEFNWELCGGKRDDYKDKCKNK